MPSESGPGPDLTNRLGYLLKHTWVRMEELNAEALDPFGIDARELGVMILIGGAEPGSQQEAARRLGVDRTTMVAVIDSLEDKGLVSRRPDAEDRRRNVVVLTRRGGGVLRRAREASDAAERRLIAALGERQAEQFRRALRRVVVD